jgi:hypothetical protein
MARVIEAEARITAVDATGKTFELIASKVKGLSSAMKSLGSVASSNIASANRMIGRFQHTMNTLAPVASGVAAMEGARGVQGLIHGMVKAAAERAHEAARMAAGGFTDKEMAEAAEISEQVSKKYKALSATTVMHSLRNLKTIVGTFDEAAKLIDPIAQLRLVTLAAHPERKEELEAAFDKLEKSQEMIGATQDPARFRANMDFIAKSMNLHGDTLRPDDYYDLIKYARQAGQGYNDRFLFGVGPTLAMEMAGKSAGEALSSFFQQFVAGKMPQYSMELMKKYDLIGDPSKVEYTKAGLIKRLEPGAILGHQMAKEDPNRWLREVFLPHLAAKGVTTKEQIADVIAPMASKRTTGQAMGIFATQQSLIDKDLANFDRAMGLDAAQMFMNKDPFIAMAGVTAQFQNLLAIAGGPLAGPAAENLNRLAGSIVAIENATKDHPWAATAGVGAGIGLLGAGSLAASMWALRSLFGWGRGLASTVGAAGSARVMSGTEIAAMRAAMTGGAGAGWLSSVLGPGALMFGAAQAMAMQAANGGPTAYGARGTSGFGIGPVLIDALRAFGVGGGPPHWSTSDIRAAVSGPAEVKGSADLNVNVQVEPSDSFIARIISAIRNDINVFGAGPGGGVGTAGSTGLSMPPAGPNP